jgi:hypothetical protein
MKRRHGEAQTWEPLAADHHEAKKPDEKAETGRETDSPLEGTGFEPSVPLLRKAGHCQSEAAARKAKPLTGSGPKRQCLPGVAAHSLSLRGGTASSNPSSSTSESGANLILGANPIDGPQGFLSPKGNVGAAAQLLTGQERLLADYRGQPSTEGGPWRALPVARSASFGNRICTLIWCRPVCSRRCWYS